MLRLYVFLLHAERQSFSLRAIIDYYISFFMPCLHCFSHYAHYMFAATIAAILRLAATYAR